MNKKLQLNLPLSAPPLEGSGTKQETAGSTPGLSAANPPIRFIRIGEVTARTQRGRSTIYEMVRVGEFPAPIRLGTRAVAWIESEVEHWIQSRIHHRADGRRRRVYPGEIPASAKAEAKRQPFDGSGADDPCSQGP